MPRWRFSRTIASALRPARNGNLDFIPTGYKFTQFDTNLITSSPALARYSGASNCANFTTATHVLLGFTGVNCAAGRLRLLGAMA